MTAVVELKSFVPQDLYRLVPRDPTIYNLPIETQLKMIELAKGDMFTFQVRGGDIIFIGGLLNHPAGFVEFWMAPGQAFDRFPVSSYRTIKALILQLVARHNLTTVYAKTGTEDDRGQAFLDRLGFAPANDLNDFLKLPGLVYYSKEF